MSQNETGRIVSLAAQMQQIRIQPLRYVQFTAVRVIARLTIGYLKELRGRSQPLPQLARGRKLGAFRVPPGL